MITFEEIENRIVMEKAIEKWIRSQERDLILLRAKRVVIWVALLSGGVGLWWLIPSVGWCVALDLVILFALFLFCCHNNAVELPRDWDDSPDARVMGREKPYETVNFDSPAAEREHVAWRKERRFQKDMEYVKLLKPNYKDKDGNIKPAIRYGSMWYAPKEDLQPTNN